ncbi:DNA processing protein DprA [Flavimobilis marinus]|uniref:DNA protecting protein DprA n=1 Tax=Flavimobilis marinus TaxID=285351 RepID=A0A1I2E4J9_9MICO|nr:DNA-processing protein DprA [Flavimobilis marinus]GHG43710.1 DNA processing protein DprA [Flavimobilis marinus]SFE87468.1 DNA protecting protein DprA [Flavimobilis marinus]
MTGLRFDVGDAVLAAAAWSRLAEPADAVAGALVRTIGAGSALRWLDASQDQAARGVAELVERGVVAPAAAPALVRGVDRWRPRLAVLDPARELRVLARLGGRVVLPGSPGWPAGLDDLGAEAPFCLWVRGRSVDAGGAAIVGARASTEYGNQVASDLATGLADRGVVVVSGGAYGIDAAAHRGALAAGGASVAVLAGGVDRLYPAGNARLLEALCDAGAVTSEVPPGSVPSRVRFLQRNRLIAALTVATVVVEAAWRSGALSTAGRAAELLRPVGAVPGPVTSAASAGCHRLLREQGAVCVTDAAEVAELVGAAGEHLPAARPDEHRPGDGLAERERRVFEALPLRRGAGTAALSRAAGLGTQDTMAAAGTLELAGLAVRDLDGWRRVNNPPGRNGSEVR